LLFDVVWLSAVWGRDDWLWLTLLLVVALYASTWRFLWARRLELLVLVAVGLAGEYLVVALGVLSFTGTDALPMWLLLLWLGFAGMSLVVFTWLGRRYWLAALAGLIFGPITYLAGIGFGAAEALVDKFWVGVSYSLLWACLMMLVVYLIQRSQNKEQRYV
jgi:hypothetical protein